MAQSSDSTPTDLVGDNPVVGDAPETGQQHTQEPESPSKQQPAKSSTLEQAVYYGLPFGLRRSPGNDILYLIRTKRFLKIELRRVTALFRELIIMGQDLKIKLRDLLANHRESEENDLVDVNMDVVHHLAEIKSLSKEAMNSASFVNIIIKELREVTERVQGSAFDTTGFGAAILLTEESLESILLTTSDIHALASSTIIFITTGNAKVAHSDETTTVSSTHGANRDSSLSLSL